MEHFTPFSSAAGGALIGLSAAVLWLTVGRIAGISGILGGLGTARGDNVGWRIAFLVGLVAAPLLYVAIRGAPTVLVEAGPMQLIVAGLLVGFGTRLGGGCTSGHGVCGLARLSRRSLVATGLFIGVAVVTVFVTHHIPAG